MKTDFNFFPGWTRKSITFTIDDGRLDTDKTFIDIMKPAKIKGTFNLNTPLSDSMSEEEYRAFYNGFGIANHCHLHPHAFIDGQEYKIEDEKYENQSFADVEPGTIYKTDEEGVYRYSHRAFMGYIMDVPHYMECVKICQARLEEVFGKGTVKDYVWPFCRQDNKELLAEIGKLNFRSMRSVTTLRGADGFAMPKDRSFFNCTANAPTLLECAAAYDAYPDDGELKMFSFGYHSSDYMDKWEILREFADKYGNRENDFYYASVGDILDYEDAVKSLVVTETDVFNPSALDVYGKIDGAPVIIRKGERKQL